MEDTVKISLENRFVLSNEKSLKKRKEKDSFSPQNMQTNYKLLEIIIVSLTIVNSKLTISMWTLLKCLNTSVSLMKQYLTFCLAGYLQITFAQTNLDANATGLAPIPIVKSIPALEKYIRLDYIF